MQTELFDEGKYIRRQSILSELYVCKPLTRSSVLRLVCAQLFLVLLEITE